MTEDVSVSAPQPEERTLRAIHVLRLVAWALVGVWFLVAAAILALRYFVLPNIDAYKDDIAALMSKAVGEKVTIGQIEATWHGLHPYLSLADVRVHDRDGAVALHLPAVDASVGWRSLIAWELRFHSLAFDAPDLRIRRDAEGRIFVAGIELAQSTAPESALADWVLRQGEVVLRDGRIQWLDEKRGAPLLVLAGVGFRLTNRFNDHHFAIAATPPREFASKLDLRGRLEGDSFQALQSWTGKLFAEVDYVDLAAWKAWIDYPVDVRRGSGALRAWLSFADGRLIESVADVGLTDLQTRLAADLPMLDVASLSGRFGARETQKGSGFFAFIGKTQPGYEVFGEKLAFGLRGEPALKPTDFRLRWQPKAGGKEGAGEFRADAVELEPLAALVEHLPFPGNVRRTLSESEPKGTLREVNFTWDGPAEEPNRFSARGRFDGFALRPHGGFPGFSGLAGMFGVNESSGSVTLQAAASTFEYPGVLSGGPLAFDSLTGRATWTRPGGVLEVKLDNVAVASPEIAATLAGVYRERVGAHGDIDLTLRGSRALGRAVYKFIPHLSPLALDWLRTNITAGGASDIRLRLKGDVADFPFDDPKTGAFELAMKVTDAALDIGYGWPKFERVYGDLSFEGRRMIIAAAKGVTTGVPVTNVRGRIPDLFAPVTVLEIEGQAEGRTDAFMRYVDASPVKEVTDQFTAGMRAEGRGKLALKLELPLEDLPKTKVAGSYQFLANTIYLDPYEAPATDVNGTLSFTEQGMAARGISGRVLGGPFTVSATTREGVVQATAQGTATVAALAGFLDAPSIVADRVRGSLDYTATARLRGRLADVVVESSLQGVSIDFPAPFAKGAQESWPTRVERSIVRGAEPAQRRENLMAQIGQVLAMNAQFRQEGGRAVLDRAAFGVGAATLPALPRDQGVTVTANLAEFDYDRFQGVLPKGKDAGALRLDALNATIGLLTAAGRRFHDVDLGARFVGDRVRISIVSREAAGEVIYDSARGGSVLARLKHFTYPESAGSSAASETVRDLPTIDVVADSFTLHGHTLGKLELDAVNEGVDWRIRRLSLVAPEGSAMLEGIARPPGSGTPPRTDVSFTIDVKDVGAYLDRIGLSGVIARGDASLTGKVAWNGPVYDIDYPTLTGNVALKAESGQFLKVKPGIGKLLGVLSLQSLGRRLTLDFRDVFGEGFAFDTITANAMIAKGVASTTDFSMTGPSASVAITGTANLAKETQDLHVRVVPSIGDSAAVAAGLALVNPMIGLGALLAQRVLKDPIGQMLAFEYQVTGSWEDPIVERVRLPQVAGETPIPREQIVPGLAN